MGLIIMGLMEDFPLHGFWYTESFAEILVVNVVNQAVAEVELYSFWWISRWTLVVGAGISATFFH